MSNSSSDSTQVLTQGSNQGSNPVITHIASLVDFRQLIIQNRGVFIVKLGAEWCGPCKRIEPLVASCMRQMSDAVQCAVIDVDESFEVYAFLKNKRVVNGIPAILAYYQGNDNYIPDDVVVGSDEKQVVALFARAARRASA